MKTPVLFIFLMIVLSACGQIKKPKPVEKLSVEELLNKIDPLMKYSRDPDSAQKAVDILDEVTTLDSSLFYAYQNKLDFYITLNQFDKAVVALDRMIMLKPDNPDIYQNAGLFRMRAGDSISAKDFFMRSKDLFEEVLETLSPEGPEYSFIGRFQMINLIMLDDKKAIDDLARKLADKEKAAGKKKQMPELSEMTKRKILDDYFLERVK